tara:strand:- start:8845 stop:9096 length:252 start_codon:yes stop_codon:yes gene_type:complete
MVDLLWLLIETILYIAVGLAAIYLISHLALWFWGLLKELVHPPTSDSLETDTNKEVSYDDLHESNEKANFENSEVYSNENKNI